MTDEGQQKDDLELPAVDRFIAEQSGADVTSEVEPSVTEIPAAEVPQQFVSTEAPAVKTGRFGRIPPWVPVALVVVVIATIGVLVARRSADVGPRTVSGELTNKQILDNYAAGEGGKTVTTESFRATFPSAPRDYAQTFGSGKTKVPTIFTSSFIQPELYSVSVSDYRGQTVEPRALFDRWLAGLSRREGSKLLSSKAATIGGNPAVDYELRSSRGYVNGRLLFADGRLYHVLVNSEDQDPAGFNRFLGSFRLRGS